MIKLIAAVLVVGVSCSKGHGEQERRQQIVASINAIAEDHLPPPSQWPSACADLHQATRPGDTTACSMGEKARREFQEKANGQLQEGLIAFITECGAHRGLIADRIAADRGYVSQLVAVSTSLVLPVERGREHEFTYLQAEVRQAVKRTLATCFETETLGTAELAWIRKQTFQGLPTIDDADLAHVGALDPKSVTSALENELRASGAAP